MLSFVQNWLLSIAAFSIVLTVTLTLTPEGQGRKAVRLCGGLVMALLLLQPVRQWSAGAADLSLALPEPEQAAGSSALKQLIEERTGAYIVNEAQALGLEVNACVTCDTSGAAPVPAYVEVICADPENAKRLLSDLITRELGISQARQRYEYER